MTDHESRKNNPYRPIPIGTSKHPWPTVIRGQKSGARAFGLGIIQSDTAPLWLQSTREYNEVMPELYRGMPVESMLEAFEGILNSPLVYLQSDPGYGKSYLANLVSNAMHHKGAVIYDAGGKNMESLLYETVFDSDGSSDLVQRINTALREGTLTEPSIRALRELKITPTSDEDKKTEVSLLSEEGGKKVFDWKGLQESNISREKIDSVLASISRYQEWGSGLSVGFKDVEGALIRAAKEHRPLVIDEFSRRKPGTEAALQQIWQVINGEINSLEVLLGNLGSFTLHHGDIPKVILTANKPKDGADVFPISDSLKSRLKFIDIPAFSQNDWSHRFGQLLTSVPVTTLARLEKGKMKHGAAKDSSNWEIDNQIAFKRNLKSIRTTNVSNVPSWQLNLLNYPDEIIEVSKAFGKALHETAALLDPDSPILQQADMAAIRMEVDKPGDRAEKVTPRAALQIIQQATYIMAEGIPAAHTQGANFTDWSAPAVRMPNERIETRLGDRMKLLVEKYIDSLAGVSADGIERPKLYSQLNNIWKNARVLGSNSLLDKLNITTPLYVPDAQQIKQTKTIIDQLLKSRYPDFTGVKEQTVETFLAGLQDIEALAINNATTEVKLLTSVAGSVAAGQYSSQAIVASRALDSAGNLEDWKEFQRKHPPEILVDQDRLIATIALPYLGKEMLTAISGQPLDNKADLFITTVVVKAAAERSDVTKLHVLHNKSNNQTLVIAKVTPSIKLDSNSNVKVVDMNAENAEQSVIQWLRANANGKEQELLAGFRRRNTVTNDVSVSELSKLLVNKDIKTFAPAMVDDTHQKAKG